MVIYVTTPNTGDHRTSVATDMKKIILSELIDDAVQGITILDSRGVPVIHHLPSTVTLKSLRTLLNLFGMIDLAKQTRDESLGELQYVVFKYSNYKVMFMEIPNKRGWLIVFVNPVWHVENVLPKIRQFLSRIAPYL